MPISVFSPELLVLQLHSSDLGTKAHQSLFNGSLDLFRRLPVIFLGESVSYSLENRDLRGQQTGVPVWFSLHFAPSFIHTVHIHL